MQDKLHFSLNAVRAFTVAAKHLNLSFAAAELGVTPSAVSHQIKKLEYDLGTPLFLRGNNSISLTAAGHRLFEDAGSGIAVIDRSAEALSRDANEIVIRVSVTLAVRWLIPALEKFKQRYPLARVRMETSHLADVTLGQSADAAVTYRRVGDENQQGELLLRDFSRPVLSPNLLASSGYGGRYDIGKMPALKCTEDNWDWRVWADRVNLAETVIKIAHEFDTDDAALKAAVAGFGMVLAPALTTRMETDAGTLVALPGFEPIEIGRYHLLIGPRRDGMVSRFRKWILAEMAEASAPNPTVGREANLISE